MLKNEYETVSLANVPYFCGGYHAGTLLSSHPSIRDGASSGLVCFRPANCYIKPSSCHDCTYTREILIRNCGGYYVYWLQSTPKDAVYCTTTQPGGGVFNGMPDTYFGYINLLLLRPLFLIHVIKLLLRSRILIFVSVSRNLPVLLAPYGF